MMKPDRSEMITVGAVMDYLNNPFVNIDMCYLYIWDDNDKKRKAAYFELLDGMFARGYIEQAYTGIGTDKPDYMPPGSEIRYVVRATRWGLFQHWLKGRSYNVYVDTDCLIDHLLPLFQGMINDDAPAVSKLVRKEISRILDDYGQTRFEDGFHEGDNCEYI